MRRLSSLGGLALGVALTLSAGAARAAENEEEPSIYPVQYVQRPLTLSELTLSPYVSLDVTRFVKDTSDIARTLDTNLGLEAGAIFGITPNLEVQAALATIQIKPTVAYGNPTLGATYRLLNSGMEVAVRGGVVIVTTPEKFGAVLEPSAPALVHLGKSARFDFSVGLPITFQKGQATTIGIDAPVAFAFQLADAFHIGVRSSIYISDFREASRYLTVPLGFFAGISIGAVKPFFEIDPFFTWTKFTQPGAIDPGAKKLNTDIYSAGVAVRGFFYL